MNCSFRFPLVAALAVLSTFPLVAQEAAPYENGGIVPISSFVPTPLVNAAGISVDPNATNDGIRNTYNYSADGESQRAVGTELFCVRLNEYRAIRQLEQVQRNKAFTDSVKGTVKDKAKSVGQAVTNPVDTLAGIPKGLSRMVGRAGEGMKGQRSNFEDGGIESAAGVSAAKRKLAVSLGVNPYTTNKALQRKLGEVAWVEASAGIATGLLTSAVAPAAAATALTAIGVNQTFQKALTEMTPEDIRMNSRKKLLALGVKRETVDRYLAHPWYSPASFLIMTEELRLLRSGASAEAFLNLANRARSEEDAYFYQRSLDLAYAYSRSTGASIRFVPQGRVACFIASDSTFGVPYPADYILWTQEVAGGCKDLADAAKRYPEATKIVAMTNGRISARFRSELQSRGIAVHESVTARVVPVR